MRVSILIRPLLLLTGLGLLVVSAYPLNYPHNEVNGISCSTCHYEHGGQPILMPPWTAGQPQNIDDTPTNTLCWSCHNDLTAPYVRTHSSLTTDDDYGDWSMECRTCHNPHQQQFMTYGSDSYLYSGQSTAVSSSTITQLGAGWTPNQFQGLVVIPNVTESFYNYKIHSNTEDTLTVEPSQGQIDLSKVSVGDTFAIVYGKLIKNAIRTPKRDTCEVVDQQYVCAETVLRTVKFYRDTGPNSFADGDDTAYDGVCEVCHTQTTHFRNDGSGPDQLHNNIGGAAGTKCTTCHSHVYGFSHSGGSGTGCEACHGHDAGYEYEPGKFSAGRGTFKSHSTHTENDSDDLKGPNVPCDTCHDTNNFPYFKSGTGTPPYDLAETDVCDDCHSKGGAFDGVDDPVIGAKSNWADGVYDGDALKSGKEKWCVGCHDSGTSVVHGVQAPNVAGDQSQTWGYYVSGHGQNAADAVECLACHDAGTVHVDGEPRTYSVASDNYQAGYRLATIGGQAPLRVPINYAPPKDGRQQPEDYRLCFSCHDKYKLLGDIGRPGTSGDWLLSTWGTNFREEEGISSPTEVQNGHYVHVGQPGPGGPGMSWDSDGDGAVDSAPSCPACHNVHGSPSPAMIRHGELISTPGTGDKVPALDFRWYEEDGTTITTILANSRWGQMPPMENPGPTHIDQSYVCNSCHGGPNSTKYYRGPVEGLTTCVGCHQSALDNQDGKPVGGRQAVVDQFGRLSHHVVGASPSDNVVTDDDCLTCHAQKTATHSHMDGTVALLSPDVAGTTYAESAPGAFRTLTNAADLQNLTSFCQGCHDGNGAQRLSTPMTPFSDGKSPPGQHALQPRLRQPSGGPLPGGVRPMPRLPRQR